VVGSIKYTPEHIQGAFVMDTKSQPSGKDENSELKSKARKRMLQVVIQYLIMALVLFLTSGKLDWIWAWAYMGVNVIILAINSQVLSPGLMAERGEVKENVEPWDRTVALIGSIFTLAVIILPGLDLRFGWSPPLAPSLQIIGVIFYALGMGWFTWSMASNPFFSASVRIQMDRDQTVATGGPYRYVRHPGYIGYTIAWIATAIALGSLWTLIPAILIVISIIIRTALEDKTLQQKLPGYREYAEKVRYRLIPGIW
jgi:protein-S-isoprenylcysteine O-methyltransferase Ste14